MTGQAHGDSPQTSGVAGVHKRSARFFADAYSGEHGVYGVVTTSALIALGIEDDTDLDVLLFVVGTVLVLWIAHLYSAVVAAPAMSVGQVTRTTLRKRVRTAARHSLGLLVATLFPALLLLLGVVGWVDEDLAYLIALGSGVVILALIGFGNATRNGSSWPMRLLGAAATASLGLFVIGLSILTH